MKTKWLWGAALALAFGLATPSFVGAQQAKPTAKNVMTDVLKGGTYEDMMMQVVDIPPGGVVPWHIHPDGHEISYIMSGEIALEVEGSDKKILKAGDGFHIQVNTPHAAKNESSAPAQVLVVRLKPHDKPVAVPVKHQ
jgi:quercetin dioxygenase-like cupin family protein